ncbi:uncharacterized protein BDV14DRAFT_25638 [Aspergillus stella-maris]|uniref:uncharacterized protein n=1 Tax=Aspergillus stella-maris TaxID=1810926 RepID=UPI003CCD034F
MAQDNWIIVVFWVGALTWAIARSGKTQRSLQSMMARMSRPRSRPRLICRRVNPPRGNDGRRKSGSPSNATPADL